MAAKVRITRMRIKDSPGLAMQTPKVRAELAKMAERARSRVEALGASEGVEMNASTTSGTRPKGRPFTNVVSENVAQEWGNRYVARRRILGRVAEEFTSSKRAR